MSTRPITTLRRRTAIALAVAALALGEIANGPYDSLASLGLIVLFNAIMFTLLEVPLVGYLVRPERTAAQVARLSIWLNANGLRIMGALIGAVGVSLVVQGIAAAAG